MESDVLEFSRFEIEGLFGNIDISFPIKNNRIIIVGYNGVGKSTVLNIFYLVLSRQWQKLQDFDFDKIFITLNNGENILEIDKRNISIFLHYKKKLRNHGASFIKNIKINSQQRLLDLGLNITNDSFQEDLIDSLSRKLANNSSEDDFFKSIYLKILSNKSEFDDDDIKELGIFIADEFLKERISGRILYLPTYRRIEKDIKTVFPELEEDIQRILVRRNRQSSTHKHFVELVQFGMDDVKKNIEFRLEQVKNTALVAINRAATQYLRDVIRNEVKDNRNLTSDEINEHTVQAVFSKVDDAILTREDKKNILDVVAKLHSNETLVENEIYVAGYIMYLVELGKKISQLEVEIYRFIELCNSYLFRKKFIFDNKSYRVLVINSKEDEVGLDKLSSGEKQIVSLFSHLILGDINEYIIFIDEPELSLSSDWQEKILSDISSLPSCNFLCAVTHSPFIFNNYLNENAVDIVEHSSESLL